LALYSVGSITATDADATTHHATYHITTGPVRDFVYILTRGWAYLSAKGAPVPIDVHYKGDSIAAQEEATIAAQAFTYYDSHFGPYPYAHLTFLVLSFPSGGIQYPTLLLDDNARDTNYHRFIASHEVAHEWFYGVVGNDPLRHAWLDESLAQISLYLFFRDVYGQAVAEAEWTHILTWSSQAKPPHVIDTPVMQFTDFSDYMAHTYGTGAVFMRQLADQIGYDQFITGLSAYFKQVYLGIGTPQEFLAAMQAQTSIPLAPIFCSGLGYGCAN
jgi:aminopeptidase N